MVPNLSWSTVVFKKSGHGLNLVPVPISTQPKLIIKIGKQFLQHGQIHVRYSRNKLGFPPLGRSQSLTDPGWARVPSRKRKRKKEKNTFLIFPQILINFSKHISPQTLLIIILPHFGLPGDFLNESPNVIGRSYEALEKIVKHSLFLRTNTKYTMSKPGRPWLHCHWRYQISPSDHHY